MLNVREEKYRPQFHFTPPANWMNDPNGMVYYDGEYHLFYQHHPDGTTWGPMHWGHAVSSDLVHWEHLPIALAPDEYGTIFSGSAVVDWNDTTGFFEGKPGLVAIFTHSDHDQELNRPRQRQSLAYSADKGRTWTKYEGNPVLASDTLVDFRDPKVFWHEPSGRWIMILATGDRVQLYTSPDLKAWTFGSEFGQAEGSHEGVWECPDLIELPVAGTDDTKWVMLVSIGDNPDCPEGSRTQYFIGDFDGSTFTNDNAPGTVLWLDHGRDNYAGVTWSNADGPANGKLFIGWMSNWKYANLTPTVSWRSAMTLPRVLSLRNGSEGIRVIQHPIGSLTALRGETKQWGETAVVPGRNLLEGVHGGVCEIVCELEPGEAAEVGIKLRASEDEETVVGYDIASEMLFIDRRRSGESAFHPEFACKHGVRLLPHEGRIKLHIFVDQSSIEVFANDGEAVLTDLIFPDPRSTGMELYAQGGSARLLTFSLHVLKSMYSAVTV
ncbi:glycoside hydrolase family 32 protein [Paenibacillus nanensis]|uniref:Glycoside hydrolase family 32 protein n=1 Tax=Paenibacillus nanensis TaxID=393251 RepID=A0A3A1UQC3_9BACL|nr:glycoside hydrolase family 32 protein [Paenibacillus nanensis]RIX48736.1 glycoside hydrolase family 32 protein [Paenibacillus nanensis]